MCDEAICGECEGCTCGGNCNQLLCECPAESVPDLPFEIPEVTESII